MAHIQKRGPGRWQARYLSKRRRRRDRRAHLTAVIKQMRQFRADLSALAEDADVVARNSYDGVARLTDVAQMYRRQIEECDAEVVRLGVELQEA
jgi:hypothetical protein